MKKNPEYPTPNVEAVGEAGLEFWAQLMDAIIPDRELTDADVVELGDLCSTFETAIQEVQQGIEPAPETLRRLRFTPFRLTAFNAGDESA